MSFLEHNATSRPWTGLECQETTKNFLINWLIYKDFLLLDENRRSNRTINILSHPLGLLQPWIGPPFSYYNVCAVLPKSLWLKISTFLCVRRTINVNYRHLEHRFFRRIFQLKFKKSDPYCSTISTKTDIFGPIFPFPRKTIIINICNI